MKKTYLHPDAIEAVEVWPNGKVTAHLSNGETHSSVPAQEIAPELLEYAYNNMVAIRGTEIKKAEPDDL